MTSEIARRDANAALESALATSQADLAACRQAEAEWLASEPAAEVVVEQMRKTEVAEKAEVAAAITQAETDGTIASNLDRPAQQEENLVLVATASAAGSTDEEVFSTPRARADVASGVAAPAQLVRSVSLEAPTEIGGQWKVVIDLPTPESAQPAAAEPKLAAADEPRTGSPGLACSKMPASRMPLPVPSPPPAGLKNSSAHSWKAALASSSAASSTPTSNAAAKSSLVCAGCKIAKDTASFTKSQCRKHRSRAKCRECTSGR